MPYIWAAYSRANTFSVQTVYDGASLSTCSQLGHSQVQFTHPEVDALSTAVSPSSSSSSGSSSNSCTISSLTGVDSNGVQQDVAAAPTPPPPPPPPPPSPQPSSTTSGTGVGLTPAAFQLLAELIVVEVKFKSPDQTHHQLALVS